MYVYIIYLHMSISICERSVFVYESLWIILISLSWVEIEIPTSGLATLISNH